MKRQHYNRKPIRTKRDDESHAMVNMNVMVPRATARIIQKVHEKTGLPISRLIAIAIDNEVSESVSPFNYPCLMPTSPYVEYAYADEAGKLLRFIQLYEEKPMTIEQLMLCRRDAGIPSREVFMLAYRELLEKNMIEEFSPRKETSEPGKKRIRPVAEIVADKTRYRSKPELDAEETDEQ